MKIQELNKTYKFEPFTFEVTIENKDELLSLWHYLNTNIKAIKENAKRGLRSNFAFDFISTPLWTYIDDKIEDFKLKELL